VFWTSQIKFIELNATLTVAIDFGPIQFDDKVVLRQLQQDLKDDWFPELDDLTTFSKVENNTAARKEQFFSRITASMYH